MTATTWPNSEPVLPVGERRGEADGHAVDLHLLALGRLETAVGADDPPELSALGRLMAIDRSPRILRPDAPAGVQARIRPEVIGVEVADGHVGGADRVGFDP